MNYTIRRCMISDAHRIFELCKQELGYKFSEQTVVDNVRRLIGSPDNRLIVAVTEKDEVIGFIHAHNHNPVYAPPLKSIVAIAVDPKFRHMGIGSKLVNVVEEWAKETGAAGVRVNTNEIYKDAVTFYKGNGYNYIKTTYNFRKMFEE